MQTDHFTRSTVATLGRAPEPHDYIGLDYETASRRAQALCRAAGETGRWFHLPAHLEALRGQMR